MLGVLPHAQLLSVVSHGVLLRSSVRETESFWTSVRLSGIGTGAGMRWRAVHLAASGRFFTGAGVFYWRLH